MSSSPNSSSSSDRAVAPPAEGPITALNDVVCTIDVVLGTSSISVGDCLRLQRDSIIRLDQAAGGNVEVSINGVAVARGEVMIVEDSTAIRITDIVPPPSSEIFE